MKAAKTVQKDTSDTAVSTGRLRGEPAPSSASAALNSARSAALNPAAARCAPTLAASRSAASRPWSRTSAASRDPSAASLPPEARPSATKRSAFSRPSRAKCRPSATSRSAVSRPPCAIRSAAPHDSAAIRSRRSLSAAASLCAASRSSRSLASSAAPCARHDPRAKYVHRVDGRPSGTPYSQLTALALCATLLWREESCKATRQPASAPAATLLSSGSDASPGRARPRLAHWYTPADKLRSWRDFLETSPSSPRHGAGRRRGTPSTLPSPGPRAGRTRGRRALDSTSQQRRRRGFPRWLAARSLARRRAVSAARPSIR
mmetsp:Transcript_9922/g.33109  ORF Transcript_9922/g.33109 Transcript_9922/m.33109 type:complete len:319 (-) Transcript_9922:371-1327(-)